MQKQIDHAQRTAKTAVKIALIACGVTIVFAMLSIWISLNQITATAHLTKMQNSQEARLQRLENP